MIVKYLIAVPIFKTLVVEKQEYHIDLQVVRHSAENPYSDIFTILTIVGLSKSRQS